MKAQINIFEVPPEIWRLFDTNPDQVFQDLDQIEKELLTNK